MIASVGMAFAMATEENVTRMSREIISLQNRLRAAGEEGRIGEVGVERRGATTPKQGSPSQ